MCNRTHFTRVHIHLPLPNHSNYCSVSRRGMRTRRPGEDPALFTGEADKEEENKPKAPSLGKGQDLLSEDPDARPKAVIAA